jgi:hypothetical protein
MRDRRTLLRQQGQHAQIVSSAAGMLPLASRRVMRQSTCPLRACTTVPPALVMAAYSRSVPTAVAGWMPNRSTSNGVISEPPPTPVSPTMAPTTKPDKVYIQSMARRTRKSPRMVAAQCLIEKEYSVRLL